MARLPKTGFRNRTPGMEAVSADAGIANREQDRP